MISIMIRIIMTTWLDDRHDNVHHDHDLDLEGNWILWIVID